ncbi:MAG: hypothetical protein IPP89_14310 [Saprospiraceae bacterium]|nr:hypothetical protein [Candidatus Brachybacter algidus]MBL0120110.1 hypothetical protein [Candidatus Brachybacter algidus]
MAKVKDRSLFKTLHLVIYIFNKRNKKALSKLETALTQSPNPDQIIQIKTTGDIMF